MNRNAHSFTGYCLVLMVTLTALLGQISNWAATPSRESWIRKQSGLEQSQFSQGARGQGQRAFQATQIDGSGSPQLAQEGRSGSEKTSVDTNQPAPLFAGTSIAGKQISIADFKGKIVVLDFWATYCSVCMAEIPQLKDIYARYKDRGLEIIGIALDENVKDVQKLVTAKNLTWLQIHDGDSGPIIKLYKVKGTPTHFVLDRDGKIAAKNVSGDRLAAVIASLIDKDVSQNTKSTDGRPRRY